MRMNVEHKTASANKEETKKRKSLIPMTMRESFFDDPFFKDTWTDIETSQKNFFEESRKRFEESMKGIESKMLSTNIFDEIKNSMLSNAWTMPDIFGNSKDSNQ